MFDIGASLEKLERSIQQLQKEQNLKHHLNCIIDKIKVAVTVHKNLGQRRHTHAQRSVLPHKIANIRFIEPSPTRETKTE